MKCTVGWTSPEFDYEKDLKNQSDEVIAERLANGGYERGCQVEATHEVRQNHRGDGGKILETTYHIGYNCEDHCRNLDQYVVEELK